MNLIIDIGNTSSKAVVFRGRKVVAEHRFVRLTIAHGRRIFSKYPVEKTIYASVVKGNGPLLSWLKKKNKVIVLNHKTPLPFRNAYKTKQTLGNDRLANAAGAHFLFPEHPVLMIDAGTCVKYDILDAKHSYIGGAISPGMNMRYVALHEKTSKLPLIRPSGKIPFIGATTKESILSGVQQGMLNEMEGYISKCLEKFENLKVVLTGGDAPCFAHLLNFPIFAAPQLTVTGLNEILLHQK